MFLSGEYVAVALIHFKNECFGESFVTMNEYHRFVHYLQQEFNQREKDIVIVSWDFAKEDFTILNVVILTTTTWRYQLERVATPIRKVLMDRSLFTQFFRMLEIEKIEELRKMDITFVKRERVRVSIEN